MRTALIALAALVPSLSSAQRVEGWRKVTDSGTADSVLHDRMPPGWHITTGPAAILFDPANQAKGRFAVEAEIHLLVQGDSAVFSANGQRIAAISARELSLEGTFGFRVGAGVNLHITNLDLVTRLAPYPVRR